MRGKSFVFLLSLVFCLCAFLLESASLHAEEWTAEQKGIIQWLQKYAEVTVQGNVDENMTFFHPKFSGWDLAHTPPLFDKGPFDMEFLRFSLEESYKLYKITSFKIEPLAIVVEGNFAVVHVNLKETTEDSQGVVKTTFSRWTAGLVKQDNNWSFLSWGWIAIE